MLLSKLCEGKLHSRAGCRLTTFVLYCPYKTALVSTLKERGKDDKNILFQGHASHFHIHCSSSSILVSLSSPSQAPNKAQQVLLRSQDTYFCQGWQTDERCMQSHAESQTCLLFSYTHSLFSPLSNTNTLFPPHTYTHTHSHTQASGLVCYFIFYVCLKINSPKLPLRPPFLWLL